MKGRRYIGPIGNSPAGYSSSPIREINCFTTTVGRVVLVF